MVTLSPAQQASSIAESQQIILSAPLPVIPHTYFNGTESMPKTLPPHFDTGTPELLHVFDTLSPLHSNDAHSPESSPALEAPKPMPLVSSTEPNESEVDYVMSESSNQPLFPDPVGDSSDRLQDVHNEAASVEDSIAQYENPLQKEVDDEIHQQAAEVMQEVSGGRRIVKTDCQRPFDPNLVCPMCRRQFRIGEIQKFKKHVNTCTGTDD